MAQYPVVRWARLAFLLYAVLTGAASAYVIHRVVKVAPTSFPEMARRVLLILLVMAGSLHGLYLMFGVASFPHYQVILLLLPSLAVALLLVWIAERFRNRGVVIARTLLVVVLAANVSFGSAFLAFVTARPEAIHGDYGQPYFVERQRWQRELEEAFEKVDRETRTPSTTAANIQSQSHAIVCRGGTRTWPVCTARMTIGRQTRHQLEAGLTDQSEAIR